MAELRPPYSKEQLVQLFAEDVPYDTLRNIAALLDPEPLRFSPSTPIVLQGEPGDGLYFIAQGTVEVTMKPLGPGSPFPPVKVAELSAGDVVGEMALVNAEPRNATVSAVDEVMAYRLGMDNWRYIEAFYPGLAARIRDVAEQRARELALGQHAPEISNSHGGERKV